MRIIWAIYGPYGVHPKYVDYHNPLNLSPGAVGSGEEAIEEREVENAEALCCRAMAFPVRLGQSFRYNGPFQALCLWRLLE